MPIDSGLTYFQKHLFSPLQLSQAEVDPDLKLVICVPVGQQDDPYFILRQIGDCGKPECGFEVIFSFVVSDSFSQTEKEETKSAFDALANKVNSHAFRFPVLQTWNEFPQKHFGKGLARKAGMDEAAFRLLKAENPKGIIVCLDPACRLSENYLLALESHALNFPQSPGWSIYFEYPIEQVNDPIERDFLICRELKLRYHAHALRLSGYPFWYYPIGAAMAVRAEVYCKMGGMNRKTAWEDFHFLNKIMPLGGFSFLNSAVVYPQPGMKERNFRDFSESDTDAPDADYPVYAIRAFKDLRVFLHRMENLDWENPEPEKLLLRLPLPVAEFLKQENFTSVVNDARKYSTGKQVFMKRFYAWFDGLLVLRYLNFCSKAYYPDKPIFRMAHALADWGDFRLDKEADLLQMLMFFRKMDKGNGGNEQA